MKVVVFGVTGQVAHSLKINQPSGPFVTYLDRHDCDLSTGGNVTRVLDEHRPDFVVNAAAYTAVDKAEQEIDIAKAVNGDAPREIAAWVSANNARLIHISTDFVFDGSKQTPYLTSDPVSPLGVYGDTKLLGEQRVVANAPDHSMIIRTAWVYSEFGNNFVKTMLRLMSEREEIGVVDDQRGSPTSAGSIARIIWLIIESGAFTPGIYHWTDSGEMTWWEFALAINELGRESGLLGSQTRINAITTADYPTPARRPAFSVLDTSDLEVLTNTSQEAWKPNLRKVIESLSAGK